MKKKFLSKKNLFTVLSKFFASSLFGQLRFFRDVFPNIDSGNKNAAFSSRGLIRSVEAGEGLKFLPVVSGHDISGPVLSGSPSFLVETVRVLPYGKSGIGLLDVYNSLGRVRDLKGRLYHSASKDKNVPLFEDATRIESPKKPTAIPDPPPSLVIPRSEIVYTCMKDVNFGNSYYEARTTATEKGLLYTLSNFKTLSYGIIPVIGEHNFVAQFYVEPVNEGLLVYGVASIKVSALYSSLINFTSALRKRFEVIILWFTDGLK